MGILLEWGVWGLGAGEMTMMVQRMRPVAPMKVEDVVGLSPIADVGTGRPDPGHVLQIHPTEVGDVVPLDPMDPGCAHARDLETMVPRGAYTREYTFSYKGCCFYFTKKKHTWNGCFQACAELYPCTYFYGPTPDILPVVTRNLNAIESLWVGVYRVGEGNWTSLDGGTFKVYQILHPLYENVYSLVLQYVQLALV